MKMKPVDPNAVLRDPHTKRPLPAEGGDVPENSHWMRRWLAGETWRLEGKEWVRRLPNGEIARAPYVEAPAAEPEAAPPVAESMASAGTEPVAPTTTSGGK